MEIKLQNLDVEEEKRYIGYRSIITWCKTAIAQADWELKTEMHDAKNDKERAKAINKWYGYRNSIIEKMDRLELELNSVDTEDYDRHMIDAQEKSEERKSMMVAVYMAIALAVFIALAVIIWRLT